MPNVNWASDILASTLTLIWAARSEVRMGVSPTFMVQAASQFDQLADDMSQVGIHGLSAACSFAAAALRTSFTATVAALSRGGNIAELYKGVEGRADILAKLDSVEDELRVWWLTVGMHTQPEIAAPEDEPKEDNA